VLTIDRHDDGRSSTARPTLEVCPLRDPDSSSLVAQAATFERSVQQETATMKIRPLQDRVIVKRVKEEEKTKGGIIIPDTAKEKPIEGEVVAVGNGKVADDGKIRPLDVKPGDRVLFGKYSGTEVKIDGEEHLMLREDDILGVIER
jgi:chaperonin GroES